MVATRSSPDVGARRRVVVTGLGVVTPIGFDLDAFWKAALAGVSGVRRISHFDPEGLPTQIAAALAEPALIEEFRAEAELDALEPRGTVVGVRAARGAVVAAGASAVLASPRAGVFVGDRKSTRLNSSHLVISYAVFCLKKKKKNNRQ